MQLVNENGLKDRLVNGKQKGIMNNKISFQERAKLGLEELSKQSPITLAKARSQAQKLETRSKSVYKKQRS